MRNWNNDRNGFPRNGYGNARREISHDVTLERSLPNDEETEKMILGCIILDNNTWYQIPCDWTGHEFFNLSHRKVFEAMRRLMQNNRRVTVNRNGAEEVHVGVDPITLQDELRIMAELDAVGGPAFIASLFDGVPRFSNIESYLDIVRRKYQQRRLITEAYALMLRAYDDDVEIEQVVNQAEESLFQLKTGAGGRMQAEWFDAVFERAWGPQARPRAIGTGMRQLDSLMLGGGVSPGDLVIVAARTSRGKSTFAMECAGGMCDQYQLSDMESRPVGLFFALEQTKEALVRRIVADRAEISWESMQRWEFSREELDRVHNLVRRAQWWRLATYDIRRTTISDIAKECRRVRREAGRLDFVVVDHLSLIKLDKGVRYEKEYQEIGHLTSEMKTLAGERGIQAPFIVPTQVKREALNKKRFDVDDLRGSGAIEQDSDKVIILQMPEQEDDSGYDLEITLAKQREGQVGSVMARFSRAYGGFREIPGTRKTGLTSERRRIRQPEPDMSEDENFDDLNPQSPRRGRRRTPAEQF